MTTLTSQHDAITEAQRRIDDQLKRLAVDELYDAASQALWLLRDASDYERIVHYRAVVQALESALEDMK